MSDADVLPLRLEHQAREIKNLTDQVAGERSTRQEYEMILKELQPQMFSIEDPD